MTAVGGDLGQAIVKALRLMPDSVFVVGADIQPDAAGVAFVEAFSVIPPASEEDAWMEAMDELCRLYGVQAVIPGCEPEMYLLARRCPQRSGPGGTAVVAQSGTWLERYGDKLRCMDGLAGRVDLAPYADGADRLAAATLARSAGYPLVVKPRRGSGSVAFRVVRTDAELMAALESCPVPLVQGYIDDDGGEFSVGVFACPEFSAAVSFRRRLGHGGASWFADNAEQDPEVLSYCRAVANASGLHGSCNVQVRKSRQGVRLLEINPRFSSLVAVRAACGFADLEWSLKMALNLPLRSPPEAYRRIRFLRFAHELVDLGEGFGELEAWRPRTARLEDGWPT